MYWLIDQLSVDMSLSTEVNQQSGPLGDDVKGGEAGVLGVANLDA